MATPDPQDQPSSDQQAAQRLALQRVALRSRVRSVTGGDLELTDGDLDPSVPAFATDGRAYYQAADVRGLGPALRWASANGATALTLLAEADVAGDLARRAAHLRADGPFGTVEVWAATGADVEPAEPSPVPPIPELDEAHLRFASLISEAGARPVDDHGLLVAEVAGLEVARVVDADDLHGDAGLPSEDGLPVGGPRLSVGVGQADRELQGFIHGHLDDDANLRRAIAAVVRHRNPASAAHPLGRLSRQRWLRSALLDDPGLVGLESLEPVPPLRPRETLLSQEPIAARGPGTIVVCSVGVDLDLLPEAADYRHRDDPEAELVVVVPERDRLLVAGPLLDAFPRLRLASIASPWEPPAP